MLKINDTTIFTVEDAKNKICALMAKGKNFKITVSMDQKVAIHHEHGIPTLYVNQLTTIVKSLEQIKIVRSTNQMKYISIEYDLECNKPRLQKNVT